MNDLIKKIEYAIRGKEAERDRHLEDSKKDLLFYANDGERMNEIKIEKVIQALESRNNQIKKLRFEITELMKVLDEIKN